MYHSMDWDEGSKLLNTRANLVDKTACSCVLYYCWVVFALYAERKATRSLAVLLHLVNTITLYRLMMTSLKRRNCFHSKFLCLSCVTVQGVLDVPIDLDLR